MEISFEHSLVWILPIIAVASAIAWWVYFYKKPYEDWSANLKRFLSLLRWSVLVIVSILLLKPFLVTNLSEEEKPKLLLYLDESESVDSSAVLQIKNRFKTDENLSEKFDLEILAFGNEVWRESEATEDQKLNTDFGNALTSVNNLFFNDNIGAIVMASDGIQTKGLNPMYVPLRTTAPVYTVALGDSSTASDFELSQVLNNKMVFLGNDFQIKVRAIATKMKGETALIKLTKGGKLVEEKSVEITSASQAIEVDFVTTAEVVGVNQFNVLIVPNGKEENTQNNALNTFIEVLDNRTKVTILAKAPHPDLAAFKAAIATNDQYEVEALLLEDWDKKIENSDLFILHGLPVNAADAALIQSIKQKGKPILAVFTSKVNLGVFNTLGLGLNVQSKGTMTEQVGGGLNTEFNLFSVDKNDKIKRFPPLWSPFGEYQATADHQVLLFQSIGQIKTDKPLLAFYNQGAYKSGVLVGEGWWRWRLADEISEGKRWTDELILKAVQYLALKQKRNRLNVLAPKQVSERQNIAFKAELYNESYELTNSEELSLTVSDSSGQTFDYKFLSSANAYQLDLGSLPNGSYKWRASASVGGDEITETGEFLVVENRAEFIRTKADFNLLNALAKAKGGEMFGSSQLDDLIRKLNNLETAKAVIHTTKDWKSIIEWKWILFLIAALLTLEWFLRKYNGYY